jgi:hypothetical protein
MRSSPEGVNQRSLDRAQSIVTAAEGRAIAVQWEPVCVGRDIVAGTVVAKVILGFPWWIHDEVVGPGNDLQAIRPAETHGWSI